MNSIEIGDRVQAGKGEDRDAGKVLETRTENGEAEAFVGWDSGVRTWHPVRLLEQAE